MKVIRVSNTHSDFEVLINNLDRELADRYGAQQEFFNQFNHLRDIKHVVIGYENEIPTGCGAFKIIDDNLIEIKRMYLKPIMRGTGLASLILKEIELWGHSLGFNIARLETGTLQPDAIRFYEKNGYQVTKPFAPYIGVTHSICMKKHLQTL